MSDPRDNSQVSVTPQMSVGAVLFAMLFPSVLTYAYFVALADFPPHYQQLIYSIGKTIQFGFPLVWVWLVLKRRVSEVTPWRGLRNRVELPEPSVVADRSGRSRNSLRYVLVGVAFGIVVAAGMWLLVHLWLQHTDIFPELKQAAWGKIADLGLNSAWKYAAVALFYALMHSFLEEYYWRWFVYGQLRQGMLPWPAILLSGIGFMLHHVILLATYFGWTSPLAYVSAAGVGIGGLVWAFLYEQGRSLLGPWISHMLVDAAIFWVGFELVRQNLS